MSSTNKTPNINLSQFVAADKPTFLQDYNSDMLNIDASVATKISDAPSGTGAPMGRQNGEWVSTSRAGTQPYYGQSINVAALERGGGTDYYLITPLLGGGGNRLIVQGEQTTSLIVELRNDFVRFLTLTGQTFYVGENISESNANLLVSATSSSGGALIVTRLSF